jgi:hypothetical protein
MESTSAADPGASERQLSAQGGGEAEEVPFPRYLIALVQDESEMLLQPAYDLFAFLDDQADQRWEVELYTERTFEALLRADTQFDCIVIGLNAAYKSKLVRDALSARLPSTGLCVLHQFQQGSIPFLVDDLGLEVTTFKQPAAPVLTAEKLPVADEILLNWPATIDLAPDVESDTEPGGEGDATGGDEPVQRLIGGEAFTGLVRGATSSWRTVLEVNAAGRRLPVLVRTPSDRAEPPVVVCSVLLRPRERGHMGLLNNIVSYCVAGRPEVLVAGDSATSAESQLVHRKLRMQGIKAVSTQIRNGSPLDFEHWPYRGISDVVLPEDLDPTAKADWPRSDPAHARSWLQGGGRISRLGPRERLTVTHRESDAHWVTRNWASWFLSEPAAVWHGGVAHGRPHEGSLISTRAVLRFLAAIHGGGNERRRQPGLIAADEVRDSLRQHGGAIDPRRFGLDPPEYHLEPVTRMLRKYVDDSSPVAGTRKRRFGPPARHIHYSVSTTCALLDVNALMAGEPLDAGTVEPFERWLKSCQFPNAALDDKLEIARCLGDDVLLKSALQSLSRQLESPTRPLTAALVTKLREAIVACDLKAEAVPTTSPDQATVVERALRTSPLLCANYLVALGDLRAHWGPGAEHEASLATPDPRVVDRAVIGIGRHGSLDTADDRDAADTEAPYEMRSTKALALLAFFGRHAVPTHVIRPEGTGLPPDLVASVLQESEQLRRENAIVVAQTKTLDRARHLLAGLVLAVVAMVIALLWMAFGDELDIPLYGKLGLVALFVLLYPGATVLLRRWDLAARWGRGLARIVAGGVSGLKDRVKRGLEEGDVPPSGAG